jgi:hypothetical protein
MFQKILHRRIYNITTIYENKKNDQNMGSVDLAWNNLPIYYLVVFRKIMNEVFSFGLLF